MPQRLFSAIRLPLPLIVLCLGVLAAVIITALVSQRLMLNKLQATSDQYGASLANIAARQAIDATLDGDFISLQVILSDIVENPDVVVATIHDVENKLLAQAGTTRASGSNRSSNQRRFTAAITLQDSVAGHVTVTVDQTSTVVVKQQLYWLFALTGILLLALTLTAYFFGVSGHMDANAATNIIAQYARARAKFDAPAEVAPGPAEPFQSTREEASANAENEHEGGDTLAESALQTHSVLLVLRFHNLNVLGRQLSQVRFTALQANFDIQLQSALPLYNGDLVSRDKQQAVIRFDSVESVFESTFHACCYTFLLMALSQQQDLPIEFSAGVYKNFEVDNNDHADQEAVLDTVAAILAGQKPGELLLATELIDDPNFCARLVCHPEDLENGEADFVRVTNIREPYQQLLQKQTRQLQHSHSGSLPIYSASS